MKKRIHCNPLLPLVIDDDLFRSCSLSIRELLGSVLETALLGDGLASEYLLCHLISSVYSRQVSIKLFKEVSTASLAVGLEGKVSKILNVKKTQPQILEYDDGDLDIFLKCSIST